ncbi:MAG: TolC family protein [Candidatus Omnitrophica bacterium]|nr:TolC family protein [Candidatus Omnitrophota bacterium]
MKKSQIDCFGHCNFGNWVLFVIWCLVLGISFTFRGESFAMGRRPSEIKKQGIDKEAFIESARTEQVLRIGLLDCITFALKNNSEILIKRIEPKLKEGDIKIAKADFEPTFSADWILRDNTKKSTSTAPPEILEIEDTDFNAGLSGKLITGTEYDIDFLNQKYKSNATTQKMNPYYTSEPKITITQPLFRDFGIFINRADIIIARNNKGESEEVFKDTVMEVITKTKIAYYNYIYYLENYSIAKLSLKRAQDLLEINKARYAKGLLSSVDLLETETAAARREKVLISAESNLKKAEDDLKLITNLVDNPRFWNAKLELIDRPKFDMQELDLVESLENAFELRPDYQAQKLDLKNRDIKIKVAKNALFPTLDLTGSFGLNGLGKDYEQCIDKINEDYKDWSIGLKFSLPWGGGERAKYNQRKLEKAQALIAFKRLEQDIVLEIRDKVREVDIQYRQVEASRVAKEKETENYRAQEERYAAGEVNTHDMLDYQDKLAQAELDYIKSLIDYNIAVITLEKGEGLTLVKNDIILEE